LTSFPARIDNAWIAIESLFQQDFPPQKVILVLSKDEFVNRELPKTIRRQQKRGLEVIWSKGNIRSYKKLLPTKQMYPEAVIMTADDDLCYEPWCLRKLIEASMKNPGVIIGHRGWVVTNQGNEFLPYVTWPPANAETPPERCFLTSGAGTLYPPHTLPSDVLLDIDTALEICPTADDIWFWAAARYAKVPLLCLGKKSYIPVRSMRSSPALHTDNTTGGQNDLQIRAVLKKYPSIFMSFK
jgi:hypothetical protein